MRNAIGERHEAPLRQRLSSWLPLLTTLALAVLLALSAGGCEPWAEVQTCHTGELCVCDSPGACVSECVGGGCLMECRGSGACTFECPDGGCAARSSGTGATTLSCEGNDCELSCRGTGACTLSDCKAGCELHCDGAGACVSG